MSIQQLFSLFIALASLVGIVGSSYLQMTVSHNIGPGMMPMIYSIILLMLSGFLFLSDKKTQNKLDWHEILKKTSIREGMVFYLLCYVMLGSLYLFGFVPSMTLFCVISLLALRRQKFLRACVFSIAWVFTLYAVFVIFLHIPLPRAYLF